MIEELETGLVEVPEEVKKTASKVGYLTKQGAKWKTWKTRYFVLKGNLLYYFAEPKDTIPKGVIVLNSGLQVANAEKQTKRKFCFSLSCRKSFTQAESWSNRVYYFQSQKDEDMKSWMEAIQKSSSGSKTASKLPEEMIKLFRACGKGELSTVRSIVSERNNSIDLIAMDDEGNTPLHWACVGGHIEVVRFLLDNGVDVEIRSRDGFTPMHSVAQEDRKEVLELLIQRGAKVNTPNINDNGNTTLHYAACWGALNCAKVLLANGASVDALAQDKSTPLSFAAEKGHLAIAKALIEAGAQIESKNDPEEKGGATPLLLAAHNGQLETLKYLLEKGANPCERTIDGLNALHLAIRSGSDNDQLLSILIDVGADINGRTNNGDSPLHYAAFMGYVKCCSLLIRKGAIIECKGQNGSSPLHFASREGQSEVVKLLIENGASLNSKDKDNDTPLSCAIINEHEECAEILREAEKQRAGQ